MPNRLQMIEQMLETQPGDSFLHYCAALEHQKIGHDKEAIHILKQVMKNDPDYLASYYQLGKLLETARKPAEAIAVYQAGVAVARKQNDSKTLGELTEALMILDVWE